MKTPTELQPTYISKLPSGSLVLCDMQHLRGYCILKAEPMVASLNDLPEQGRLAFLRDMARVGDVLTELFQPIRINYAIFGNSDNYLHAHIAPRYASEPEQYRRNTPWSYPKEHLDNHQFDPIRDAELIRLIAQKITDLPN
jgi:diadenosine tetraphosphate (Ap4A) HIT family hydrolase